MKRFFWLGILTLVLLACSSVTVASRVIPEAPGEKRPIPITSAKEFSGCGGQLVEVQNADFEQAVVEQTNQIRMKAGLSPLKREEELNRSARYHAADMSHNNYFDHNSFDRLGGELSEVCDTWNRIESFYSDWLALAENIAAGQRLPEIAMDGWMNSPDHRHNILSESYWEIGAGFYEGDGEYRYYWVQNFGRSSTRYPLVIEGEKARTDSSTVSIYIYGEWDEMRLRVDGQEWSEWQPFRAQFEWTLPDTPGIYTVTAELRGFKSGNTITADTIEVVE